MRGILTTLVCLWGCVTWGSECKNPENVETWTSDHLEWQLDSKWAEEKSTKVNELLSLKKINSQDWYHFLKSSTTELADLIDEICGSKKIRRIKSRIKTHVGRGWLGRFFLGDRLIVLPQKIQNKKHLAEVLIRLTELARERKIQLMREPLKKTFIPFFFVKEAEKVRRDIEYMEKRYMVRDVELLIFFAAAKISAPKRIWPETPTAPLENILGGQVIKPSQLDSLMNNQMIKLPGFFESAIKGQHWANYGKTHWASLILWTLFYAVPIEDEDPTDFGNVGDGSIYHAAEIEEQDETFQDHPQKAVIVDVKLSQDELLKIQIGTYDTAGDYLTVNQTNLNRYTVYVAKVLQVRFRGETVFERYARAAHNRTLSFKLGKQFLWMLFDPKLREYGLSFTNFMLHKWTPEKFKKLIEKQDVAYIPSFMKGEAKQNLEKLQSLVRSGDAKAQELFNLLYSRYAEVTNQPVFNVVYLAMMEDQDLFEKSKSRQSLVRIGKIILSTVVASKAQAFAKLQTRMGWVSSSTALATFGGTYYAATTLEDILTHTNLSTFWAQEARLLGRETEYDVFIKRLDAVYTDKTLSDLPLVHFLKEIDPIIRMPNLLIRGRLFSYLQKSDVKKRIATCLGEPGLFVSEEKQLKDSEQFLNKAFTYPMMCELYVLATHGVKSPIKTLVIKKGIEGEVHPNSHARVSVLGQTHQGTFVFTPRTGWPNHVSVYVLGSLLWMTILDQYVKDVSYYPTAELFEQACLWHVYMAMKVQTFMMMHVEGKTKSSIVLWSTSREEVQNRAKNDKAVKVIADRALNNFNSVQGITLKSHLLQQSQYGSQVDAYWLYALRPFPLAHIFKSLKQVYGPGYRKYYLKYY